MGPALTLRPWSPDPEIPMDEGCCPGCGVQGDGKPFWLEDHKIICLEQEVACPCKVYGCEEKMKRKFAPPRSPTQRQALLAWLGGTRLFRPFVLQNFCPQIRKGYMFTADFCSGVGGELWRTQRGLSCIDISADVNPEAA